MSQSTANTRSFSHTRTMVECALLIAIGIVLGKISIFSMPYGGSVTLFSALPFVLISFRHGIKWGLLSGFVNGLIGIVTGFYPPPSGTIPAFIGVILLDYLLAFMALGLADLFAKPFHNRLIGVGVGTVAASLLRLVCSFLSGWLLWGSYQDSYEWAIGLPTWAYSLIYNGSYMIPETILTAVAAVLLCRFAPKLFTHVGGPVKAVVRVKAEK